MKNENQDLLDLKIEIIDNGNTKSFQEVALLVDKPEYLKLIDKTRNEYPYSAGERPTDQNLADIYSNFFCMKDGNNIDLSKYKRLDKFKKLLPNEYKDVMAYTKNADGVLKAQAEAVSICFEFGRPFYFVPIVLQSLLSNFVEAKYLQRASATILDSGYALYRFDELKTPQVVIEVSPHSTYKDIKEAIRDSKNIFETDPRFKYFGKKPDYVNEIRKYRYWYWDHLAGKMYTQIADEWMDNPLAEENDSGSDENVVLKGIQTYQKLLEI